MISTLNKQKNHMTSTWNKQKNHMTSTWNKQKKTTEVSNDDSNNNWNFNSIDLGP